MRKAILPMIASLALCGAAVASLLATNARAEQNGRKPVMLALMAAGDQPDGSAAAPRATAGPPSGRRQAMMGPRREQFCQDIYARKAGELAFLEAKLSLNAKQAPLFARWKQTSLDVAKRRQGDCTAERGPGARGQRLNVVERQAREEDLLKKRLADIQIERPALTALYAALTPAQKEEFGRGGMHRMARRMMMGMKDRPHPGMGPGMGAGMGAGRGAMDEPPGPPPPPAQ